MKAEDPEMGRIPSNRKEHLSALARQLTSQALIEDWSCQVRRRSSDLTKFNRVTSMGIKNHDFLLTANKYDIPEITAQSPGISIAGDLIKSVLLSTDLSYIQNLSADAILIINAFEKSNDLDRIIIEFSQKPVICDVGGGLFREEKTIRSAVGAIEAGAAGVVITKPTPPEIIERIRAEIEVPLVYTVMFDTENFEELADAGVDIFNISTGEFTPATIEKVRKLNPDIKIMANGGPHDSTIQATIEAGADAIVCNPPTATEILRSIFDAYKNKKG